MNARRSRQRGSTSAIDPARSAQGVAVLIRLAGNARRPVASDDRRRGCNADFSRRHRGGAGAARSQAVAQRSAGSAAHGGEPERAKDWWVKNIHDPTVTAFPADASHNSGTAIVILPGGAHEEIVWTSEGINAARAFNRMGISVFVVKYRLARESGSTYSVERDETADVRRAMQCSGAHSARIWLPGSRRGHVPRASRDRGAGGGGAGVRDRPAADGHHRVESARRGRPAVPLAAALGVGCAGSAARGRDPAHRSRIARPKPASR